MNTLSKSLLLPVGVIAGSLLTAAVVVGQAAPLTTLTSPNGQFVIDVQDNGISLRGPGIDVQLANGGVVIDTDQAITIDSDQAISIDGGQNVAVIAGQDATVTSATAAVRLTSAQDTTVTSNAGFRVDAVQAVAIESDATFAVTSVQDTSFDSQANVRIDANQDTQLNADTAIRLVAPVIEQNGQPLVVEEVVEEVVE